MLAQHLKKYMDFPKRVTAIRELGKYIDDRKLPPADGNCPVFPRIWNTARSQTG